MSYTNANITKRKFDVVIIGGRLRHAPPSNSRAQA